MRCLVCVLGFALGWAVVLPAQTEPEVRSIELNGRLIRYQVRAGFALVQGDIIIGTAAAVEAAQRSSTGKSPESLASILTFNFANPQKWTKATMPYVIDTDVPNPQRILDGIAHWNTRTPLKIVARTTETNYLRFVRSVTLDAACSSYVGMIGGGQVILTTDACSAGAVIHELGHAWGLQHEQIRADRNGNVTVLYQNMDKRFIGNFDQDLIGSKDTGYYDFGSIMHYGANLFTRNGLDTMETVPVGIPMGQLNALSAGDIDGVSRAYDFIPTATTIATVPSGLPIIVDGVGDVSPKSFDWAPGSMHTVSVNTQAGSADPRYVFVRWSDGGDFSHTITADPGQTVFCAVYQTQHRFSYDVGSGSGTVTAMPPSIEGYYPERQPVRISATPAEGSQFIRWAATGTTNLESAGYSVSTADATIEVIAPNTQYLGTFTTLPVTTIESIPRGRRVTVDGASYLTPVRFAWTGGSTHTLDLAASQTFGNNTVHYQFTGWDDGGSATARTITAGSAPVFTAIFSTKYLLTTNTIGSGGIRPGPGTISVSPSSPDGYYDAGTKVQITAVPNSSSALRYWIGDLAGGTPQQTLTMDDQHDVTAYFNTTLAFTVLNAASFISNPQFDNAGTVVTPGEIVTIFGTNLGPASLATAQLDANGNVATTLAATRVLFDGVPSPMIYTSATQISAVVPFAVAGKSNTSVRTEYNGVQSGGLSISVADSAPALFTANATGIGQIAALNQDYLPNSPSRPAEPNTVVQLYATGGGPWTESIPDGQIIGSHLVAPKASVYARVGKLPAKILYVGTAPSLVNGALQINILLPKELIGGPAVPIQISVGNYTSLPGTTLAVK